MKKIFAILIFSMLLLSVSLVSAHEHDFTETKQLIDSGISCDKLTDEQLETIGDYYMEQMHPGEAHEIMDKMMGGSFGGGSGWLWDIVGMLFWIAVFVALILLIIWLYKKITGQATNGGSALEILKKRFAKGEITKKEFESVKKEIR